MLCTWLRLKHVLTEEVVLARHDTVVTDVQYLLRKVLPFTIGVQAEVAQVE